MRVIIYGLGAVGGTIAAALANAGQDVEGIARGPMLVALRDGPLRLRHPGGVIDADVPCFGSPSEIVFRPDDLICLTMKTHDTEAALHALRRAGARDQAIFCLQNGIANEAMALRYFPNVHGVTVMMPAAYTESGQVLCYGAPRLGLFDIGRFPGGSDDADLALAEAFGAANMSGFVHSDVMASKRGKLLLNLGNALEAALGHGTERGDLPQRVRAEAEAVFRAAGLAWDNVGMDVPRRKELMQIAEIAGAERFGGSTLQSLIRGTGRVETDFLNGEIAYLGRLHGVDAPLNAFLASLMAGLAERQAPPGAMELRDLEAQFDAWQSGAD